MGRADGHRNEKEASEESVKGTASQDPARLGREFGKLWTASTVSNLGDGVMLVATPLLAAALTRDPLLVALVTFSHRLPWILFTLISGALVDRVDRRRLMVSVGAFRTVLIGSLGLLIWADLSSIPLLCAVFFLLGTAETLFDNASQAILPQVVPRERLEKANGRLQGARIVANELAGPPFGALLFALAATIPFLFNAGSFAAAAALLLTLRGSFRATRPEEEPRNTPPTSLASEIGEGLRWLFGRRVLRTLAMMSSISNVAYAAGLSVLVLYAQELLGLGAFGYGILLSCGAVGGGSGELRRRANRRTLGGRQGAPVRTAIRNFRLRSHSRLS